MPSVDHRMTRERVMAFCFAVGSVCFVIAPVGVYARLVGPAGDAATYFAGSIPFTLGGAVQTVMAWVDRRSERGGRALVASAAVQSLGTAYFNVTTWRSLHYAVSSHHYDTLVWRPDAIGSAAFLVSGAIAYAVSPRRGPWPRRSGDGWWEPGVNLLGCVLFGVSAVAGLKADGALVGPITTEVTTSLGAACFLVCAVATLAHGTTFKSPRLRRWEREATADVEATLELG